MKSAQKISNKATWWTVFAVIFMAASLIADLLLIAHFEDEWQLIPLILIGLVIPAFIWLFTTQHIWAINTFKGLLIATAFSGVLGIYFHLKANWEFETELRPTASASDSFIESLSGALPALAPGSMIMLALLGYIYLLLTHKSLKNESNE